jgi:hypothetical protein
MRYTTDIRAVWYLGTFSACVLVPWVTVPSVRVREYVYICSPAFSQTVYAAGVHVHGVHQAVFAVTRG